jgi:hypothetical protein
LVDNDDSPARQSLGFIAIPYSLLISVAQSYLDLNECGGVAGVLPVENSLGCSRQDVNAGRPAIDLAQDPYHMSIQDWIARVAQTVGDPTNHQKNGRPAICPPGRIC